MTLDATLAGFTAGLALIVAIGAQNAFVLRQGLAREHVGLVVAVCAVSDALLIVAGVTGIGAIVRDSPALLRGLVVVGALYLAGFGVRSLLRARRPGVLVPTERDAGPWAATLAAALAFTFLNPHVYIDTVLLLGTIGNGYGASRWWFAGGAATASLVWFSSLGFGARRASHLMARPSTWRVLDATIGVLMLTLAVVLVRSDVGA